MRDDLEQKADPISSFHADIERWIEHSGLEWTFLRTGGMATNTLMWAEQIRTDGIVRWPFGAASRSLIHEADVAAVAVRALTGDGFGGAKYVLSGPRALTQIEQVHIIGEAVGRALSAPSTIEGSPSMSCWRATSREISRNCDGLRWSANPSRYVQDGTGSPAETFATGRSTTPNDFR